MPITSVSSKYKTKVTTVSSDNGVVSSNIISTNAARPVTVSTTGVVVTDSSTNNNIEQRVQALESDTDGLVGGIDFMAYYILKRDN